MKRNNWHIRMLMFGLATCLFSLLVACGGSQTAEKLLLDAKKYHEGGDNKAAIIQLKNALQKNPDSKEARALLGAIYNEIGDPVSAEKELRKAISLGVEKSSVLSALVTALLNQNQFQKVLDEVANDPRANSDADFLSLQAAALSGLGKVSEAKEFYQRALKVTPDFSKALIGLAKIAWIQNDGQTANQLAEQGVTKNPKNAEAWQFKGDLLRAQGKAAEALLAYTEALKIDGKNAGIYLAKANIEIGMQKFSEAKQDIDAAKKISTNQVLVMYAQALLDYGKNDYKAALDSLQQIEKIAPNYMPGVLLSGAVQFSLGATQQAEQYLRKYLDAYPKNIYAKKLLIGTLLRNQRPDQALVVIEPLIKSGTEDSQLYALAGDAYLKLKDFNRATASYEKANSLSPQTAAYHTALGLSQIAQGNNSEAAVELEKAANLDSKSLRTGVLLILTHLRQKEFDKALAVAKLSEKEQPDNPMIQNLMGGIYLSKKDVASAKRAFEKAVSLHPTYFPALANLAKLDIQEKKPDQAKKRFEELLKKDKSNLEAMTALASLAENQNDQDTAKIWYEKASNEHPESLSAAQLLALHYSRHGDKQKALNFARKAQASNPTNPGFMELLAQTQMGVLDKAGALDSYIKFASMLPESASAQFKVAVTQISLGNETEAIEALKKTLRIDPHFLDAQLALSTLFAKKGQFEDALVLSRQVQAQNSKSAVGLMQEGDILLAQKKNALAVQAYERALQLVPSGQAAIKLHNAMVADGKAKEAQSRMLQWISRHPNDNSSRLYLGMYLLEKSNDKKEGIDQLMQILKSEPDNVIVLNNLAWALGEMKDKRAIAYAERANQLAPNTAAVLDTLGWILLNQGEQAKALDAIQKAVSLQPDSIDIHYHLAIALMKAGDKGKARKELEALLAKGKEFGKAEEARALLKQL